MPGGTQLREQLGNECMRLPNVLWLGCLPSADCPDRLIGNEQRFPLLRLELLQGAAELVREYGANPMRSALRQGLPYAQDCPQPRLHNAPELASDSLGALAGSPAPLRMPTITALQPSAVSIRTEISP
jgi:hypothetical protein